MIKTSNEELHVYVAQILPNSSVQIQ